jgi:hypothetical protein
MTIKIQEPNIFDKILGFFGKKRGFVLHKENLYEKWGPYATFVIPRENFFKALFRSSKDTSENILSDIQEIEDWLEGINNEQLHNK